MNSCYLNVIFEVSNVYLFSNGFHSGVTAVLIIQDLFRHSDVALWHWLLTASGHHTWLFIFVIRHIFKCHKTFIIRLSIVSIIYFYSTLVTTTKCRNSICSYFGNYENYLATIFKCRQNLLLVLFILAAVLNLPGNLDL